MHAFLYIGNTAQCKTLIDTEIKQKKYRKIEKELFKIEDIRNLKKFTKLYQNNPIAIVCFDFDKASLPAQNALLKQLEEPLPNLYFYLTAENENNLLPTVLSRCSIKYISSKKAVYSNEQLNEAKNILNSQNKGYALNEFSKIKDREAALHSIKELLDIGRALAKEDNTNIHNLDILLRTYENIKANGNINLQLTNLVVSLK